MLKLKFAIFVILSVLFIIRCEGDKKSAEFIAKVEDSYLTYEDLKELSPYENIKDLDENFIKSLVNNWINTEVLFHEAKKHNFQHDTEYIKKLERFKRTVLANQFIDYELSRKYKITDEEIEAYYENNKNGFIRYDDEIKTYHFYADSLEIAKNLIESLKKENSKNLEEYLKRYKGEIKIIKRKNIIPVISRELFKSTGGDIIGPIKTDFGYHVFKIIERNNAGTIKSIDELWDEIYRRILVNKRKLAYYEILDSLKRDLDIEVNFDKILKSKDIESEYLKNDSL